MFVWAEIKPKSSFHIHIQTGIHTNIHANIRTSNNTYNNSALGLDHEKGSFDSLQGIFCLFSLRILYSKLRCSRRSDAGLVEIVMLRVMSLEVLVVVVVFARADLCVVFFF